MLEERTIGGLHAFLFEQIRQFGTGAVLDLGCGTGAWLERFAGTAASRVGVDRESPARPPPEIEFIEANLDGPLVRLGGRLFPLITSIEVIEHLESPATLLALGRKHLAPSGRFVLTTPNIHSPAARLLWLLRGEMWMFGRNGDPTHVSPITLTWLERVAPRHGLVIERVFGYPPVGFATQPRTLKGRALLAVARAVALVLPTIVPGDNLCVILRRADD